MFGEGFGLIIKYAGIKFMIRVQKTVKFVSLNNKYMEEAETLIQIILVHFKFPPPDSQTFDYLKGLWEP